MASVSTDRRRFHLREEASAARPSRRTGSAQPFSSYHLTIIGMFSSKPPGMKTLSRPASLPVRFSKSCMVRLPAFDHIEDFVVLLVQMRAGACRVGLQPPFGDAVAVSGFFAIGLEDSPHGAERVVTPVVRLENDRLAHRTGPSLLMFLKLSLDTFAGNV